MSEDTIPEGARIDLNEVETRVLGVLVEKAFLTPDVYPMTTNAMVSACNQKTNRDPVVSYSAVDVDTALLDMRQRNLVRRVHLPGSRSTKHRHTLDEVLSLDDYQVAVLSVLMLRGAQTMGELRQRTERHVGFEDLESVEACLTAMASRPTPLVRELARQPGQKENRWEHLLGDPDAQSVPAAAPAPAATQQHPPAATAPPAAGADVSATAPAAATAVPASPTPGAQSSAEQDLIERVAELENELATLRRQVQSLASSLGEPLD